ncbi:hypothetical protein ACWC9S_15045 [Streptomyces xiamenensis]
MIGEEFQMLPIFFMALMVAGFAFLCWQVWRNGKIRNRPVVEIMQQALWSAPFSDEVKRGMVRGMVATGGMISSLTVCLLFFRLNGGEIRLHSFLFFLGFISFLFSHISIIAFNFPKFLVPPHMRSEKGVLR